MKAASSKCLFIFFTPEMFYLGFSSRVDRENIYIIKLKPTQVMDVYFQCNGYVRYLKLESSAKLYMFPKLFLISSVRRGDVNIRRRDLN